MALLGSVLAFHVVGCAGKTPPPAAPKAAVRASPYAVPGGGRLVVLPAEELHFPETAHLLNDAVASVQFSNVRESAVAKVSMQVAQLSLECVEASESCYQAVGRFLLADRLLWVEVESDSDMTTTAGAKVTISLFGVEAGRLLGRAQQSYPASPTAQEADLLLRRALASSRGEPGRP
jgi:hypothetical protein